MLKGSGHASPEPLARLLEDKRAAAAARDRLVERMKLSAAPAAVATGEERSAGEDAPLNLPAAIETHAGRYRASLLSSTANSNAFSPLPDFPFQAALTPAPGAIHGMPDLADAERQRGLQTVSSRLLVGFVGKDRHQGAGDQLSGDDAIGYVRSLGYRGPVEGADEYLMRPMNLRRQSLARSANARSATGDRDRGEQSDVSVGDVAAGYVKSPSPLAADAHESAPKPASAGTACGDTLDGDASPETVHTGSWPPASPESVDRLASAEKDVGSSRTVTVADVLATADPSVRLFNILQSDLLFHEWTIASALEHRDEFIKALFTLRNMGRKTVDEVMVLLDRFMRLPWIVVDDCDEINEHVQGLEGGIHLNTSLIAVLRTSKISPRLKAALSEDVLAGLTVHDYLVDRSVIAGRLRTLQNFRDKTAAEACTRLDVALGIAADACATPPTAGSVASFLAPILDEPVIRLLKQHALSTRLENIVASGLANHLLVRDFVRDRDGFEESLLDMKNAGRLTVDEALGILDAHVLGFQEARDDEDDQDLRENLELAGEIALPPRQRAMKAIEELPEKEAQVLRARYGLEGRSVRTLQEIGAEVHVSRERVRQVQQKALRRLQKGPARILLAAFIEAEQEDQWKLLVGRGFRLPEDELTERAKRLDPLFVLALDAGAGGVRGWLDGFVHRQQGVWSRESVEVTHLSDRIDSIVRDVPTPMPFDRLRAEIGEDVDVPTLQSIETTGWTIFEGYLCTGYLGAKARRTVRLHLMACLLSQNSLFDIGSLAKSYRDMFPEDNAGSRVIQIQLEEAPHLFASFFDSLWLVFPPAVQDPHMDSLPFERGPVSKDGELSEGSTGARILRFLEASGPRRLMDIIKEATATGDATRASIGPTLLTNPCFRRVAPGFFGLYRGDDELRERLRPSLLNESHCRLYCLARHCGAPADYFPAWGADFEMDLAKWAQANASPELFSSIMSVVEPRDWPIPADLVSQVLAVKDRESRWSIGSERRTALGHRFVDPEQFLSILAHLAILGWIGWCAVNRLCGAVFTQNDAADVLAFLMLAGLVEPQDDWQACHPATPLADELFRAAAERRYRVGGLAWDDDVLAPVMNSIDEPRESLGWVGADEIETAIAAWRSGRLSTGRAYGGKMTAPPDVEETFKSPEWESLFGDATQ